MVGIGGRIAVAAWFAVAAVAATGARAQDERPPAQELSLYLMGAAAKGDAAVALQALEGGADPDTADRDGWTPLMYAAANGRTAIAALLLANGADPNRANGDKATALLLAVAGGHAEIARALIESGADPNAGGPPGPLDVAAGRKDAETVRLLAAAGAHVDAKSANGTTPLMRAIRAGDTDTVSALLESGADPNARADENIAPLTVAIARDDPAATARLLTFGADPRAAGYKGLSAIDLAKQAKAEKVAGILAEFADPDEKRLSERPSVETLAYWIRKGDARRVEEHLAAGVNAGGRTEQGWPLLAIAAVGGDGPIVDALIAKGADPRGENAGGYMPLHIAAAAGNARGAQRLTDGTPRDEIERARIIARVAKHTEIADFLAQTLGGQPDRALVYEVEKLLTIRGFKIGRVDGDYDESTVAAVRDFQWLTEESHDGKIDERLLAGLRANLENRGPVGGKWGAFSRSENGGATFGEWRRPSADDARQRALSRCEKAGGSCKAWVFRDKCFAFARRGDGWGWSTGDDMNEAVDTALTRCRNSNPQGCYLTWGFCSDGSNEFSNRK